MKRDNGKEQINVKKNDRGEKRIKRIVKELKERNTLEEREKDEENGEEMEWKEKNIKFVHNLKCIILLINYLFFII